MSVEVIAWALRVPVGGNQKVVLLGLANHAHPDGSESYPSLDTLAIYAHCDRSTARRNLRKLHDDGWIEEDGAGPRGQTKWRLRIDLIAPPVVGGGRTQPVASEPQGGGTGAHGGVAPMPPEPSIGTVQGSAQLSGDARASADAFPDDLPSSLHDVAIEVGKLLKRTAQRRGQKREVTRAAVGHAVLTFPDRDHLRVARDVENWLLHGRGAQRPCSDIVHRFRSFLGSSEPMAGPPLPAGVAPLHGRRQTNGDLLRMLNDDEEIG